MVTLEYFKYDIHFISARKYQNSEYARDESSLRYELHLSSLFSFQE
jgi:hypothetical protein